MLHLGNPNVSPPGSFRYRDPELAAVNPALAAVGPHHSEHDLLNDLNKRRTANGLGIMTAAVLEDRICQSLPPGYCRDELNQPTVDPGVGFLNLAQVVQGTRTLVSWFLRGRVRVSDDEVVRRSYICNQCPLHKPIHGCQGCAGNSLYSVVNEVVANRVLPTDAMLGACGVCMCSLRAKTRLELQDIKPHMSKEQFAQLWSRCWIREE